MQRASNGPTRLSHERLGPWAEERSCLQAAAMLPAMDHLSGPPATCPPNAQVRATGVHAEQLLQLLAPGRLIALIPTSPVRGADV